MGNMCLSPEAARNAEIGRQQRIAEGEAREKIKILLLGTGESGKSTFFKQMRLLYAVDQAKQFTSSEKFNFKKVIYGNIAFDAKQLVTEAIRTERLRDPVYLKLGQQVLDWARQQKITPVEAKILSTLWEYEGIQEQWNHRQDLTVQDAFKYFIGRINDIASENWEPTNQDILRSRARTTGVVQAAFELRKAKVEMYDVGGQKNERRKWIDQFDGVTTVLYIAAISDYNQYLYEDGKVNRQEESIDVFRTLLHYECFQPTPFILFLNKDDLFREKIVQFPFRLEQGNEQGEDPRNVDFPGPHLNVKKKYSGPTDPEFVAGYTAAVEYLKNRYMQQAPPERQDGELNIYPHVTNSTDTSNIDKIMNTCIDIILRKHLVNLGFMKK